jgi:hypothetical protein
VSVDKDGATQVGQVPFFVAGEGEGSRLASDAVCTHLLPAVPGLEPFMSPDGEPLSDPGEPALSCVVSLSTSPGRPRYCLGVRGELMLLSLTLGLLGELAPPRPSAPSDDMADADVK